MKGESFDQSALVSVLEPDPRFSAAFLFGSAAKSRLRADSDVDLAVVYTDAEARRSVQSELLELLGRLAYAAGGRDVQLVDLEAAGPALRLQVFKTGVCLFTRDARKLRRLFEGTLIEWFDWEYARRVIDRKLDQRFQPKMAETTSGASPSEDGNG